MAESAANKLTVAVEQIAINVDNGHWGMLSWLDLWDVIELLVVTLAMGLCSAICAQSDLTKLA